MKNKILICGFKGNSNTAKLLLDELKVQNKLYLENDFDISVKQLVEVLDKTKFDLIIMFGQKPRIKSLYLETMGINENNKLITNYDFTNMKNVFTNIGYKVKISSNAGNYLCNNIYYNCLKYLKDNSIKSKAIFIHIPTKSNIFDIEKFAEDFIKNCEGYL